MPYPHHLTIIIEENIVDVLRIHDIPEEVRTVLDTTGIEEEACRIFRYPIHKPTWLDTLTQVLVDQGIGWHMHQSHRDNPLIISTSWNPTYAGIPPRQRHHTRFADDQGLAGTPVLTFGDVLRAREFVRLNDHTTEATLQLLTAHLDAMQCEHHRFIPSWKEINKFKAMRDEP